MEREDCNMKQYNAPNVTIVYLDQTDLLTASEQVNAMFGNTVGGLDENVMIFE